MGDVGGCGDARADNPVGGWLADMVTGVEGGGGAGEAVGSGDRALSDWLPAWRVRRAAMEEVGVVVAGSAACSVVVAGDGVTGGRFPVMVCMMAITASRCSGQHNTHALRQAARRCAACVVYRCWWAYVVVVGRHGARDQAHTATPLAQRDVQLA